jgi:hypothetical protein
MRYLFAAALAAAAAAHFLHVDPNLMAKALTERTIEVNRSLIMELFIHKYLFAATEASRLLIAVSMYVRHYRRV